MLTRPRQFYLVSFIMLFVALSFPLQVIYLYGHSLGEWNAILNKITWFNWLVVGLLILNGYLHLKASALLKYVGPISILIVGWNNYLVGAYNTDYSMASTTLATFGFSLLFAPLFLKSSRIVLADPKRRWWRRSKRYYHRISTTMNPYVGEMIHAYSFDISKTGIFICTENLGEGTTPKVGEHVRLCLNINSMKKIRCDAIVVRTADSTGRYPKGLGLKFIDFDKSHQKSFEQFISGHNEFVL